MESKQEQRLVASVIGMTEIEQIMKLPEIRRSVEKGGQIGALILNGQPIENGIGVWE